MKRVTMNKIEHFLHCQKVGFLYGWHHNRTPKSWLTEEQLMDFLDWHYYLEKNIKKVESKRPLTDIEKEIVEYFEDKKSLEYWWQRKIRKEQNDWD